jgi:hypothetical protein
MHYYFESLGETLTGTDGDRRKLFQSDSETKTEGRTIESLDSLGPGPRYVGIVNQDSTTHLNVAIQTLF